jgi:CubicO group peptidase (beta-lactamase class C family)
MRVNKFWAGLALIGSLLAGAPALAAPDLISPSPLDGAAGHPLVAQDTEAWLDGFMPQALRRGAVAGAVVVVVKDGQVLLEKGYGVSDVATGAPVDPKNTLFRIGSVSKLFTWTAVMQQVEAGKLNLDADINTYLDFKIPPYQGKPVTLRNLMTHTGGFEEATVGLAAYDANHIAPLGKSLGRWVPKRVYAPGTTPAYSNYGAALAGYIVERVSGEPFNDYVARHILVPLGMTRTTFGQPLSPALAAGMSKGYPTAGAAPGGFEVVGWQPAGAAAATGDDMARFMIAHLQDGRYGAVQILKPETAELMHARTLQRVPPLNGMALGFYEQSINGRRVIAHGGDTVLFHSDLVLFPKEQVGLFISMNSAGGGGASGAIRQQLFEAFADRYLPGPALADGRIDAKTAAAHAAMFQGTYESSRASRSNFMSALNLLGQVKVEANDDGTISVSKMDTVGGDPRRYREISFFVWREVGGRDRLAALVENGRIVRFASDEFAPIMVYDATAPGMSASLLKPLCIAALLALLATVLAWPAAALIRRRYRLPFPLEGRRAVSYRLARIVAIVALAAVTGWGWVLSLIFKPMGVFFLDRHAAGIHVVQTLTLVGFVGGLLAALVNVVIVWRGPSTWFGKLWSVALVAAFAALTWTAWAYHLLGFNLNY